MSVGNLSTRAIERLRGVSVHVLGVQLVRVGNGDYRSIVAVHSVHRHRCTYLAAVSSWEVDTPRERCHRLQRPLCRCRFIGGFTITPSVDSSEIHHNVIGGFTVMSSEIHRCLLSVTVGRWVPASSLQGEKKSGTTAVTVAAAPPWLHLGGWSAEGL